jgi:hypothetical protein
MTRPQKDSAIHSVPAKQAQRRRDTFSFLATIRQDVRFAARQLSKSSGFAFTAILVFGLGIAASTAIFAFVDAAFVKPLPYREPSQLVALFERIPVGDRYHISYADYLDWKRQNRSFTSLDVYRPERLTLKTHSGADEVAGARVSDGFLARLVSFHFLAATSGPEKTRQAPRRQPSLVTKPGRSVLQATEMCWAKQSRSMAIPRSSSEFCHPGSILPRLELPASGLRCIGPGTWIRALPTRTTVSRG